MRRSKEPECDFVEAHETNIEEAEQRLEFIERISYTMVAQCMRGKKDPIDTLEKLQTKASASQSRRRYGKEIDPLTTYFDKSEKKLLKSAHKEATKSTKRDGHTTFSLESLNNSAYGQDFSINIGAAITAYFESK